VKVEIETEVQKLLSISFLRGELAAHPAVKSVSLNPFLYARRCAWAGWDVELQEIILDPYASPKVICNFANRIFPNFNLEEKEAWQFAFFHECRHSDGVRDEDLSNAWAKEKIVEMRIQRETLYKQIRDSVKVAMQEVLSKAFTRAGTN